MIAKLTGVIDHLAEERLVLDVRGVGYLVFVPGRTAARMPGPGGTASLHIETQVREDQIALYGFATAGERAWFRRLTGVQGVGARGALALLSVLDGAQLAAAIMGEDKASLSRADGIGPKLAGRLITELREAVAQDPALHDPIEPGGVPAPGAGATPAGSADTDTEADRATPGAEPSSAALGAEGPGGAAGPGSPAIGDALSALVNLGYRRAEAMAALSRAGRDLGQSPALDELIRAALRELAA